MKAECDYTKVYRINPPPDIPFDECIKKYKETGDKKYFEYFLHFFEPKMNRMARSYAWRYYLTARFEDIKNEIVAVLLDKLDTYGPERGVSFSKYAQPHINQALHEYVATYCGSFGITPGHYKTLRAVTYEYFADNEKSSEEKILDISKRLDMNISTVRGLIAEATDFRFSDFINFFDDGDEDEIELGVDPPDNHSAHPDIIVPNALYMDEVIDCIEAVLSYKQQQILFASLGIACIYCGRTCKRQTYAEIANDFEMSSESAAEKARKKAIEILRAEMRVRRLI